jgi:50S ribosomal protein L16 3-hydroxylase
VLTQLRFPPGTDVESFLASYWQRRPLPMPQALPGFSSPLDAEELAGLACEPELESRLVLERDGEHPWEVRHGPLAMSDFAELPPSHWTLLVQDVDKFLPAVAELLSAFGFLPGWRVDDIMVSFAADKGSVGPHLDEYDVFLIQAEGRRRWRIDPIPGPNGPVIPDIDLRILQRFEPREEYLMKPGDVLYLPPGIPHWGIAEGPCMTWSVGFRSATWREMAASWCDRASESTLSPGRYRDGDLPPDLDTGEIRPEIFDQIRRTLEQGLAEAPERLFQEWFGRFATEPKEHLQVFPSETPLAPDEFLEAMRGGGALRRNGFSRLAWCRGRGGEDLLFANGEAYSLASEHRLLLSLITREATLELETLAPWLARPDCLTLLCRLYNDGHHELDA